MNTSACRTSARRASRPASLRRSNTTLRLPRLTLTNTPLIPGSGPTEMNRVLSPSGGSTLITSAPMSAMICVQYGPITMAVRSTTRTPCSGPSASDSAMDDPLSGHPEAVPDVVVVPVGNGGEHQRRGVVPDLVEVLADILDRPRRSVDARSFGDERPCDAARDRHEQLAG